MRRFRWLNVSCLYHIFDASLHFRPAILKFTIVVPHCAQHNATCLWMPQSAGCYPSPKGRYTKYLGPIPPGRERAGDLGTHGRGEETVGKNALNRPTRAIRITQCYNKGHPVDVVQLAAFVISDTEHSSQSLVFWVCIWLTHNLNYIHYIAEVLKSTFISAVEI